MTTVGVDLVQLALETPYLRLADVVWLIAFDVPAGQIADRMGVKPNSVGMLLARHGLAELARPFWREQQRRTPPRPRQRHRARSAPALAIPVTPHGTWDRWRLHVALGEQPCASCALAGAEHWTNRRAA